MGFEVSKSVAARLLRQKVGLSRVAEITGVDVPTLREMAKEVRKDDREAMAQTPESESRLQSACVCRCPQVDHGEFGNHLGVCNNCGPERQEPAWEGATYMQWVGCNAFLPAPPRKPYRPKRMKWNDPANCCPRCGQKIDWPYLRRSQFTRVADAVGVTLSKKRKREMGRFCDHPFHERY